MKDQVFYFIIFVYIIWDDYLKTNQETVITLGPFLPACLTRRLSNISLFPLMTADVGQPVGQAMGQNIAKL